MDPSQGSDDSLSDAERAQHTAHRTKRDLTSRHGQFIAWGGAVGTGLFLTTGKALAMGGPAFLVGSYVTLAIFTYLLLTIVREMAVLVPTKGASMSYYGSRFVSRSLGFAMGWLYVYSFAIFVPFELTAAALVVKFWDTRVPTGAWITIFLIPLLVLNVLPVRFYGEAEFGFAGVKLVTIIGLLVLSFVLFWGGGPDHQRLGFHYWMHPGATNTMILDGDAGRLIAGVATIISSALPFTFTPEMIVITSGELRSPRKNMRAVSLNFTWRLAVFYVGSVIGISVICPFDAKALGGATGASSPWVVGIRLAGIHGLDSVINAVIIMATWSTANTFIYLASRSLYSLAMDGAAPAAFKKCTSSGTPINAVAAVSSVSLLAYLNLSAGAADVFNWLLNLVNTGGFISWVCCAIIYLRFDKARKQQGWHSPHASSTADTCIPRVKSWAILIFYFVLCLLNGFTVFFPSHWSVSDFLSAYIGIVLFILVYLVHHFYAREPWAIPPSMVDLPMSSDDLSDEDEDRSSNVP